MKNLFPQYYAESTSEPDWKSVLFAFDTNVLLNLYGFSKQTTDGWIEGLSKIRDQIFLPYQSAVEYHRNLDGKREQILCEAPTPFLSAFDQIRKAFSEPPKMNPLRNLEAFGKSREFFLAELLKHEAETKAQIEAWKQEFADHCKDTREKIANVFDSERIGSAPTPEQVRDWCAEGKIRYAQNIPPGFKDASKEEGNPYGDLFIWYELIALAKARNKDVVFVTFEKKPDWFYKDTGKVLARRELKHEFLSLTGHSFDALIADRFFDWLEQQLGKDYRQSKEEVNNAVAQAAVEQLRRQQAYEILRQDFIKVMAANLSPKERDVIRLRFGLDDGRQRTQEEVAQLFGLSQGRISQLEASALRKMRDPRPFSQPLDEEMDDLSND